MMTKFVALHEIDVPSPAFDGVLFETLHNDGGFAEFALTPTLDGSQVAGGLVMLAWLTSPQEVSDLSVGLGANSRAVWQSSEIENRVVWRGWLQYDEMAVRVYAINRLVEVERPVFLSVALPNGRVAVSDTVVITRYVAPPPG